MSEDPFYDGKPAWEAAGATAPSDHTEWVTVETYQPKHRADDHTPRHRAAS